MLFESYKRTRLKYKTYDLTSYKFFDQSAWPIAELMRAYANLWSRDLLSDKDFIGKFKSKNDNQHIAAMFELLNHAVLKYAGFHVEREVELHKGTNIDLKAKKDDFQCLLECTLSASSYIDLEEKVRREAVESIVDEITEFPYFIAIHYLQTSKQSIRRKNFLSFLRRTEKESEDVPDKELVKQKHLFSDSGWEIEISLLRKSNPEVKRTLGFISGEAKILKPNEPILRALNSKKPGKYGVEGIPYLICLNTNDMFAKEDAYSKALFGQYINDDALDLESCCNSGFFISGKKPINTNVSGVILFRNFHFFNLDCLEVALWHNPFAKIPIPQQSLPFDEFVFEISGNTIHRRFIKSEKDIFEMLGIERDEYLRIQEQKA